MAPVHVPLISNLAGISAAVKRHALSGWRLSRRHRDENINATTSVRTAGSVPRFITVRATDPFLSSPGTLTASDTTDRRSRGPLVSQLWLGGQIRRWK